MSEIEKAKCPGCGRVFYLYGVEHEAYNIHDCTESDEELDKLIASLTQSHPMPDRGCLI